MTRSPPAPQHLTTTTRGWWRSVVREYDLDDHHLMLLQAAAEAFDRLNQAREILAREGLTVKSRQGIKPHPCIAIERDCRIGFARLIRELDLDLDEPGQYERRPPALRSNRG